MAIKSKTFTWSKSIGGYAAPSPNKWSDTKTFPLPDDYVSGGRISNGDYSCEIINSFGTRQVKITGSEKPYYDDITTSYTDTEWVYGPTKTYVDYCGNGPIASGDRLISKRTLPDGRCEWQYQEQEQREVTKYRTTYRGTAHYRAEFVYETYAGPSAPSWINCDYELRPGDKNKISWASVSVSGKSISYEVYAYLGSSSNEQKIYTGTGTTCEHVIPDGVTSVFYRVKAYDGQYYSSPTQSKTVSVIPNSGPVISGRDEDLGVKNSGFSVTVQVIDPDKDPVTVYYYVNGLLINTFFNAPQGSDIKCSVSDKVLLDTAVNKVCTLEIKAEDNKGNVAFRRYTFKRTNVAPEIAVGSTDLGFVREKLSIPITVTDKDGDDINLVVKLNGVTKATRKMSSGEKFVFNLPHDDFIRLEPDEVLHHTVLITATDTNGASTNEKVIFNRACDRLEVKAKFNSDKLDAVVERLFITMRWLVAEGAEPTIRVCNNANDTNPTWEDMTKNILDRADCILTNSRKTSSKWAIGVWITINIGKSRTMSWLSSIGGAIKK